MAVQSGTVVPRPVMLVVLDGWGINPCHDGNAIALANPPFYRHLLATCPHTELLCSGLAVGLPEGQMGNSEVGHLNMGAGRIVYQDFTRIGQAIIDGSFFLNPSLKSALLSAQQGTLHLMGLLSDGGVHSHMDHLMALLKMARGHGVNRLRVHPFLDGRDTPPQSAIGYIECLEQALLSARPPEGDWRIATLMGRYYAMDRDKRWDRTQRAYHAIVAGEGQQMTSAVAAVQKSYASRVTDEFMTPVVICEQERPIGKIQNGDSVVFFNFRADRARQLVRALHEIEFPFFVRGPRVSLSSLTTLTVYDETLTLPTAFQPASLDQILGEVVSQRGLSQLRIAETEKYAHVTYFFSGGREAPFQGEERILIPSPKEVATYDQKPEMSAEALCDEVVRQIEAGRFDFIALNLANPDMVGHSGNLKAAIQAVEVIDRCLEKIVNALHRVGGVALITADHGNLEQMVDYQTGAPHTAHTTFPVPCILVTAQNVSLLPGVHANVAPTLLDLMQIPKPPQMSHDSLIVKG